MSVISMLVISPDRLPSIEQMRQSIALCADPLELTCDADLRSHSGFLPLRAHGIETGFEYYFDRAEAWGAPEESGAYGSHGIVARTGGDLDEARACLLFLKVAARLTGGAFVYDELVVPPDKVGAYLDEQIAGCDQLLSG